MQLRHLWHNLGSMKLLLCFSRKIHAHLLLSLPKYSTAYRQRKSFVAVRILLPKMFESEFSSLEYLVLFQPNQGENNPKYYRFWKLLWKGVLLFFVHFGFTAQTPVPLQISGLLFIEEIPMVKFSLFKYSKIERISGYGIDFLFHITPSISNTAK